MPALFLWRLS